MTNRLAGDVFYKFDFAWSSLISLGLSKIVAGKIEYSFILGSPTHSLKCMTILTEQLDNIKNQPVHFWTDWFLWRLSGDLLFSQVLKNRSHQPNHLPNNGI